MDNRYIVILIMLLALLILLVLLLWMYWSKQKLLHRQEQAEQEIALQKEMLETIRSELNRIQNSSGAPCVDDKSDVTDLLTGSLPADRLLLDKQKLCTEEGIMFIYRITQWPVRIMDDDSMVRLLGNLLDNAIEAAMKSDADKKQVLMESHIVKGQWILTVENCKSSAEHPLENKMKTTKSDAGEHGLGTQIIDKIVKKADGFVKRTDEGEQFKVLIAIPV